MVSALGRLECIDELGCGALDEPALRLNPLDHGGEVFGLHLLAQGDVVELAEFGARGPHPLGHFGVVREQQEPGVHALHLVDGVQDFAGGVLDQVHDRAPALPVACGAQEVLGLVEDDVMLLLRLDPLTFHDDLIGRVDFGAEFGHDGAVDRDGSGGDEEVGLAPHADAGVGDELVEAERSVPILEGGPPLGAGGGSTWSARSSFAFDGPLAAAGPFASRTSGRMGLVVSGFGKALARAEAALLATGVIGPAAVRVFRTACSLWPAGAGTVRHGIVSGRRRYGARVPSTQRPGVVRTRSSAAGRPLRPKR